MTFTAFYRIAGILIPPTPPYSLIILPSGAKDMPDDETECT
jgi:hypothetical protein